MPKSSLWIALVLFTSSYAPGTWAWGGQGHRIIGAIADQMLSGPARAQVAYLLAGDLDKYGRPSGRSTLEAVADWADEISPTAAGHPRWHYDNVAVCGLPPERHCPDDECNSVQLTRLVAVLADARAPTRERNQALKWIVHLLGDLHQPLHAADNDDRGGNRVAVALGGIRTRGRASLHKVWDNDLVRLAFDARGPQTSSGIAALTREAQQLASAAGQGSPQE